MTKSKKQYASKQGQTSQGTTEEFGRAIELTFTDHPWPASRSELLEHASRQNMFAKSDLARLKQIPHRDYYSISDLMDATRQLKPAAAQGAGPVTTAESNRRAMGDASANPMRSTAQQFNEQNH